MSVVRSSCLLLCLALHAPQALAVKPYTPVPTRGPILTGAGIQAPKEVYGKEFSHDEDFSVATGVAVADPQQVLAWDGSGGVMDGVDYSGSRLDWAPDQQVDAIAHGRDTLFREILLDEAHLVFSHDDMISAHTPPGHTPYGVASSGPIVLGNGNVIGGAGELSVEGSGVHIGPTMQMPWASQPEISKDPLPRDVDGVELWGPEPAEKANADKYSLELDAPSGVSIWNASGTPYLPHSMIVGAVESLLGPMPGHASLPYHDAEYHQAINLDALMVHDVVGEPDRFDFLDIANAAADEPGHDGPRPGEDDRGDMIIFSITQVIDELDPDGYYATGGELFVLDSFGGASFLFHGGHFWDHMHGLTDLALSDPDGQELRAVLDINAIEAIGEFPLLGDYNLNGQVEASDYALWRNTLGDTGPGLAADGNGDMVVDHHDYSVWRSNYGAMGGPVPSAVAGPAPEPGGLLLAGLALAAALPRRR